MVYAILAVGAIGLGVVLYLALGPNPRRWRAYRRAQKLLDAGDWQPALDLVAAMQPERQSSAWRARLENLAGESHQRAVEDLIKEKSFEDALGHADQVAELLHLDPTEQRDRVFEATLAEIRRLYATEAKGLPELVARSAKLAGRQLPEAIFWHALDLLRQGDAETALGLLQGIHEEVGKTVLDVPLYLGMLLHRLGKPQEALRYLGDANRIDSNCAFVPWQMGVSLVAANGDSGLAMRALQRALSSRGLLAWQGNPDRLWVEALPEGKSYVRRLASRQRYVCPLVGADLSILLRQGQMALAQAYYRQERYQESVDLYAKLLGDSPPTGVLLRGYGLALARLGQHDQAYKHLRVALEQEDPKDPFTAGYLALCGALGKPTNAEDKPRNIGWALKLLAKYPMKGNAEWAGLISAVHAEARKVGVNLSADDQVLLCDALASVQAHDPKAAVGYSHLAATFPNSLKPGHAWLYTRAAAVHGVTSGNDLDLFARTFQEAAAARTYFDKLGWDFGEVEYTYLARCASQAPGRFPEVLGSDYANRGEAFLLARSRDQEQAKQLDPARESVEVLLRLAPASVAAHDRLACLHYRGGNVERSIELLDRWRKLAPADHWPLVRQAVIEQERGNAARREEIIAGALSLTQGRLRASVAYLGARLALREWAGKPGASLDAARRLLEECLQSQADHVEALWCLAAVRTVLGEREALANLAGRMDRPDVTEGRFHFLGAICQLAAGDARRALDLAERAAKEPELEAEAAFVMGWARWHLQDAGAALKLWQKVADQAKSPSATHAKALVGQLSYQRGAYGDAVAAWTKMDADGRKRLGLDEPLRTTVFLSGLEALEEKKYELAAERFKEAGKLGIRDKRLGGLITLALVKAGMRLLFEEAPGKQA